MNAGCCGRDQRTNVVDVLMLCHDVARTSVRGFATTTTARAEAHATRNSLYAVDVASAHERRSRGLKGSRYVKEAYGLAG
jgi:hypothetical protein